MIQSLTFPLSEQGHRPKDNWESVGLALRNEGLDGIEILKDVQKPWEPIPRSLIQGYQMQSPLDWLDCYLGNKGDYILDFRGRGETEDYYKKGESKDIVDAYRKDLTYGVSLESPYIVFDVANADEREVYTFQWSHSDYQVMDAAIEILNDLLKGAESSFTLLLSNNRWPGFTFTEPQKTDYLLSRINYPKVGIMLDTGRLLSTRWGTKNQSDGIRYIHTMLDKHGELCKSVLGLHFNYLPTVDWTRSMKKDPETLAQEYHPPLWTPELDLKYRVRRFDRHTCWTNPECVSLIDRIEPQYLAHVFYQNGNLTKLGALTRQLKAIRKGRENDRG